jgi:MFS family permease
MSFTRFDRVPHYTRIFPKQSPAQGVATLTIISTVALLIFAFLAGMLSDRLQQRKPFVAAASALMAFGLFVLAFFSHLEWSHCGRSAPGPWVWLVFVR